MNVNQGRLSRLTNWWRARAASLLPFTIPGLALLTTLAAASGYAIVKALSDGQFFNFEAQVWGLLVGVLVGFAVISGVALARIAQLFYFDPSYRGRPSPRITFRASVILTLLYLAMLVVMLVIQEEIAPSQPAGQPPRVATFATILSLLPTIPAIFSFAIVVHRAVGLAQRANVAIASGVEELLHLRAGVDRTLLWLAVLLSLGVISSAGFQTAVRAACEDVAVNCSLIVSPEHVWLYGAALSTLLGLLYLPAELAIRHAADRLLGPIPLPGTDGFVERLETRSRGARILRVEGAVFERFQSALVIAGPLGASVLAAVTGTS